MGSIGKSEGQKAKEMKPPSANPGHPIQARTAHGTSKGGR